MSNRDAEKIIRLFGELLRSTDEGALNQSFNAAKPKLAQLERKYGKHWIYDQWWHFVLRQEVLTAVVTTFDNFILKCINSLLYDQSFTSAVSSRDSFAETFQERCQWIGQQAQSPLFPQISVNFSQLIRRLYSFGFTFTSQLRILIDVFCLIFQNQSNASEKLSALLCIDWILLKDTPNDGQRSQIKSSLDKMKLQEDSSLSNLLHSLKSSPASISLNTCTDWILDHHFNCPQSFLEPSRYFAKLSSDRYSARNDSLLDVALFASEYTFNRETYYYEAILLSVGTFEIGWATLDQLFTVKVHCSHLKLPSTLNRSSLETSPGDVLGCLLDATTGQLGFTLNGIQVKTLDSEFPGETFRAVIKVDRGGGEVYLNFGQLSPFFHVPKIACTNFHAATGGEQYLNHLYFIDWTRNLPETSTSNVFNGESCEKIGQLIVKMQQNIPVISTDIEEVIQLAQFSHIMGWTNLGLALKEEQLNLLANFVSRLIENATIADYLLLQTAIICTVPSIESIKLDLYKQRYFCLLLANLVIGDHNTTGCLDLLYWEIETRSILFGYLLSAATQSPDPSTQLYALIALREWKHSSIEVMQLKEDAELRELMEKSEAHLEKDGIYKNLTSRGSWKFILDYQIYTVAHSLDVLLRSNELQRAKPHSDRSRDANSFPLSDASAFSLLSLDPYSYRCNYLQCTVRSQKHSTASDMRYYYEVALLTSAKIRIGFGTKRMEWDTSGIGLNLFSVGYDGYEQCIVQGRDKYRVKDVPMWQAGDVFGCLLDVPQKRFRFYLNNTEIKYSNDSLYFSSEPYYAVVTLFAHQHIYFNFGQSKFKYPPKGRYYKNFYRTSNEKSVNSHLNSRARHGSQSTTTNVLFLSGNSKITARTITMNHSSIVNATQIKSPERASSSTTSQDVSAKRRRFSECQKEQKVFLEHLQNVYHNYLHKSDRASETFLNRSPTCEKLTESCITCPTQSKFHFQLYRKHYYSQWASSL